VKDAAHKTGDAVDKAGKDIKQGAQKAGDKIDRAAIATERVKKNNLDLLFHKI
jgi:ankyrin